MATFGGADFTDVIGWREIRPISHASIEGVRQAPSDFIDIARANGAVDSVMLAEPPQRAGADALSCSSVAVNLGAVSGR